MAVVTIIGSGVMGSALAFPASDNGHEVRLVGTPLDREMIEIASRTGRHQKLNIHLPSGIKYYQTEETASAIEGSDVIIAGVSSFGVDWFGEEILPMIPDHIPVLSVTKGLCDTEEGRLLTYPDLWQKRLDEIGSKVSLNAIGGPCTSYELAASDHSAVTFCGRDMAVLERLRSIMQTDYYHISLSTDVTGIESAVAFKNAYALGVALTIGLAGKQFMSDELHYNSQAAVFGQSLREMKRLLEFQGADTTENLAVGMGDLYVTVYGGRTRKIGILLGRGLSIGDAKAELAGVTLESLVVAERVARAVKRSAEKGILSVDDFPLLMHINGILTEGKPAELPWDKFTYKN